MYLRISRGSTWRGPLAVLVTGFLLPGTLPAEDQAPQVPLTKVVLFNAGVGYFERRGEIEGNALVDLKFDVHDVNDLLQSMVLSDPGGVVSAVTYASQEPIDRTLQTFAIDLTQEPTLGDLLRQIRGERVQVALPNPTTGVIVGVEHRAQSAGDDKVAVIETLVLLTDDGLASIPLDSVRRIKLINEDLDAELRQALATLAQGRAADKKSVTLEFVGAGRRTVRVGYIQESPIWKTSYRLVLPEGEADQPLLQGWAIVENATEEDWQEVSLTLVSGRPISFIMDLYQSLYVARPTVMPDRFASLVPRTHDQDLAQREEMFRRMAGGGGGGMGGMGGGGMGGMGPMIGSNGKQSPFVISVIPTTDQPMDIQQGVPTVASAADVGELFQYAISNPVTLARQQSAMLTIVNAPVQCEKVSIFNPRIEPKHPLGALELTNSTDLHLMQGPITVFDGGTYAGTARIQDVPPGSKRLVSYALDLETEVAMESDETPQQLVSAKIARGMLHVAHVSRRTQTYTIKNSARVQKRVLIERPRESQWTLAQPAEAEQRTRDLYRFAVDALPGEPARLVVKEEQPLSEEIAVGDMDQEARALYVSADVVSEAVKAALSDVAQRNAQVAELSAESGRLVEQLKSIYEEQSRIRQNMAQLERDSELYARYIKSLNQQEDQVEELRRQIETASAKESAARKALAEYIADMEVD